MTSASAHERMHEPAPPREMIVGLAAVVMEHDPLVEHAPDQHRGHRRQAGTTSRTRENTCTTSTASQPDEALRT